MTHVGNNNTTINTSITTTTTTTTNNNNNNTSKASFDPWAIFEKVEGEYIQKIFQISRPVKEQVECLKALEMRDDDVILLAFPKSGTHWLWEIISMLVSGKAQYEKRSKSLLMLEAVDIETIEAEPSPRVLNSHLPFKLLPRQIKDKKVKVIHVYRNVKDIVVSGYFHSKQNPHSGGVTIDNVMEISCCNDVPGRKYVKYMDDLDEFHRNNPDVPYFLTSYEDTKKDPEKAIRNLAEFLGVKASPELVKDIAEATTISKMREANDHKQQSKRSSVKIYRKGEVGDWKNYLTVAQSERLDAEVTKLKSRAYHFCYQL